MHNFIDKLFEIYATLRIMLAFLVLSIFFVFVMYFFEINLKLSLLVGVIIFAFGVVKSFKAYQNKSASLSFDKLNASSDLDDILRTQNKDSTTHDDSPSY